MFTKQVNIKNIQFLINFLAREDENGYIFAYAEKTALIPTVNNNIKTHFNYNNEKIGVLHLDINSDVPIIKTIKDYLKTANYKALIIANLYSYIGTSKKGKDNLTEINFSRESFYQFNLPILFWISKDTFSLVSNYAADLYAQRRLSCINFIDEETSTNKIKPKEDVNLAIKDNNIALLKKQFNTAIKNDIDKKSLVTNFVLPYLKELSKHHLKNEVWEIYNNYKKYFTDSKINFFDLATIFSNINEYKKALNYFSLGFNKDTKNNLFLFNEYLKRGNIYLSIGDLTNALEDFKLAEKLTEKQFNQDKKNVAFKNGLAISYEKLGETYAALGNLDKALDYYKEQTILFEELYQENKKNVAFKNGLAISYAKIGMLYKIKFKKPKLALPYLKKAQLIFKELHLAYPKYNEFKQNHTNIQKELDVK